jgi:hypothetical protein
VKVLPGGDQHEINAALRIIDAEIRYGGSMTTRAAAIASLACADRQYRLKQFAAIKKQAAGALSISLKSIIDCDEDITVKREAVRESIAQYVAFVAKALADADPDSDEHDVDDDRGKFRNMAREEREGDGAGGGDGKIDEDDADSVGGNDRHALEKLADLLVASGSHADKASALNFLLHDKRGTALAQRHKREDVSMSSEQHFEKALRDHGVLAVCKTAVDQGFVPCSEHALTEALTKYAVEQFKLPRDQAFAKLFNSELVVRQAIQVAKAFPNQVTVSA